MNGDNSFYYYFAVFAVIVIALAALVSKNRYSLLDSWAQENKYIILSKKQALLWRGPFWWSSSATQSVFRVKVQDEVGNIKTGWVRVTSFTWASGELPYEAVWDIKRVTK